jgi:hypothetical protein
MMNVILRLSQDFMTPALVPIAIGIHGPPERTDTILIFHEPNVRYGRASSVEFILSEVEGSQSLYRSEHCGTVSFFSNSAKHAARSHSTHESLAVKTPRRLKLFFGVSKAKKLKAGTFHFCTTLFDFYNRSAHLWQSFGIV